MTSIVIGKTERFSFECRKVIGFAFAMLHDWLKKFVPIFHPIRSKTKTNRPRSKYQYSNMAPRLSGQTSIFGVVFFVFESLLGIE